MKRREFVRHCLTCAGSVALTTVLVQCHPTHYINGTMVSKGLVVEKSDFNDVKKDSGSTRSFIIVQNEALEFPIYLYRFSDTEYSALLMKCTHQGNELSASGDHLTCSAHGSEFNNRGVVAQGPAEKNLRVFPVSIEGDKILIDLRL